MSSLRHLGMLWLPESGSIVDVLEPSGGKFRPGYCSEGHAPQGRCILYAGAKREKRSGPERHRGGNATTHTLPTPMASGEALLFGPSPPARASTVGPAEIWYSGSSNETDEQARLSPCSPKEREAAEAARRVATAGCRSRCVDIGSGRDNHVRSASRTSARSTVNVRSIHAANSSADG